jgi:large subunit ribosomal protein L24e
MNCTFCNKTLVQGSGKMFVKADGKIMYFCTMKCEKNMLKLKRKPLKTKWSGHFKKGN